MPIPVALLAGSFSERLDKAAALGYSGLELLVLDPDQLDVGGLVREVRARGLEIAAVGTGAQSFVSRLTLVASAATTEARALHRFEELVDFAAACGSPVVTIGSFRGKLASGGAGARDRLVRTLQRCSEIAGARGIRVALEPLNRYESDFINTAAEGMALAEEILHPAFGLLLDTFHMNIEEPDIAGSIHTAAARLWHVHIGDSNRLPPGQGHLDFAQIIDTLCEVGYTGYLSAELLAQPDPDAAASATIHAMRQFVPLE